MALTMATITSTSACRAVRCGRLVTLVLIVLKPTVITLLGVRPRRKTPIIGAPINTAMATITCSQSIVANRISASDAATVNWGEGWSTPTYKQWVELLSKCSHSWTTRNGVNGCLFTARNGNSIFLPAASSRRDDDSRIVGDDGCYWSCTLNKTYPDGVKGFRFTLSIDDYDIYDLSREAGMPVRAVCTSR